MKIEETQLADVDPKSTYSRGLLFSPESQEDVEFINGVLESVAAGKEEGTDTQVHLGSAENIEDMFKVPLQILIRRSIWFTGVGALGLYPLSPNLQENIG